MKKTLESSKHILEVLCYITLTLTLCFLFQELTVPKYMSHPYEGAMMAEYYEAQTVSASAHTRSSFLDPYSRRMLVHNAA